MVVSPDRVSSQDRLRIAVAIQPALFCETLSEHLGSQRDLFVVGRTCAEETLQELLSKKTPEVLVFDYEAMGPNAESVIHRLRRAAPATRVLVLTSRSGDETVERVLRAGASGLVCKQIELSVLVRAIRAVADGQIWADRRATSFVLESLTGPFVRPQKSSLTKREQEIAEACGRGLRNKEIAKSLKISEKTVKAHLNNIFRKLQVDNRFALGLRILEQSRTRT